MLVWSGWGIVVALLIAVGLLVTFGAMDALQQWLPYGPAGSAGAIVGGFVAALCIHLFVRWREQGGEARAFIDEATGERIEVRRSAGSLFFIPSRFWVWISVILFTALAVLQFNATPLSAG